MGIEILVALLSAVTSLVLGAGAEVPRRLAERLVGKAGRRELPSETYKDRLERLTVALRKQSAEVDAVLLELGQVAQDRQLAVAKLEDELVGLSEREKTLKERINALERVPLAVAEHFAALTAAGEKRSARRDYLLFGAGVVVSTLISIVFFVLQG